MALADVISAVEALLPGVTSVFGEEFVAAEGAPPRIVWAPTPDRYDGARRSGASSSIARTVKTRNAGVEIHVWGAGAAGDADKYKHLRATEQLADRVIYAIHSVAWGSYEIEGAEWVKRSSNQLGRMYVIRARFHFPVAQTAADASTQAVTITSVDEVGTQTSLSGNPSRDVTDTPAP